MSDSLRVTEVYASIQGESRFAGERCVFVRLTGCNLRCVWCDSAFTFTGGVHRDLGDVVAEAHGYGIEMVEVTGGEPLVQKACVPLMERLLALGHRVLLETSGSRDVAPVPDGVHVIMDLKAPDSGEERANLWENLAHLDAEDELKIVVASRGDYEWARAQVRDRGLDRICPVGISPAWGMVSPSDLVAWILEDRLPVRLNLQVHKYVWPPETRGV